MSPIKRGTSTTCNGQHSRSQFATSPRNAPSFGTSNVRPLGMALLPSPSVRHSCATRLPNRAQWCCCSANCNGGKLRRELSFTRRRSFSATCHACLASSRAYRQSARAPSNPATSTSRSKSSASLPSNTEMVSRRAAIALEATSTASCRSGEDCTRARCSVSKSVAMSSYSVAATRPACKEQQKSSELAAKEEEGQVLISRASNNKNPLRMRTSSYLMVKLETGNRRPSKEKNLPERMLACLPRASKLHARLLDSCAPLL